jgi:hypothetical protein
VCHRLMELKATFQQPRHGIDVDLTDSHHRHRLLIVLTSKVCLLLSQCTVILCPVTFLAAIVARVAVVLATNADATGALLH